MEWFKATCEYLGGERDAAPSAFPLALRSPAWGLWWGVLACIIFIFCGQSSKFIYIDF